jgi:CubicO group peptidase (beta-lactamase class C family)
VRAKAVVHAPARTSTLRAARRGYIETFRLPVSKEPAPETIPYIPDEKICFWGGWGGSWETMSPDRRMTTADVMNTMGPGVEGSERTALYTTLIYEAVS